MAIIPIQVCAIWNEKGEMRPLAFCLWQEQEKIKIAVTVEGQERLRLAGHLILHFFCRGVYQEREERMVLRYDLRECCWFLVKS